MAWDDCILISSQIYGDDGCAICTAGAAHLITILSARHILYSIFLSSPYVRLHAKPTFYFCNCISHSTRFSKAIASPCTWCSFFSFPVFLSDSFRHNNSVKKSRTFNETLFQSYWMSLVSHIVLPAIQHKWTHPALTLARGRCSIYLPLSDGRLSWPIYNVFEQTDP